MGIFSKHTPAPARDPRPKGTTWNGPANVGMLWFLATNKDVRDAEFGKGRKGGK